MSNVISLPESQGSTHIDPMIELVDGYLPAAGRLFTMDTALDGRVLFSDRATGEPVTISDALSDAARIARSDAAVLIGRVLDNLAPLALAYRVEGTDTVMMTVDWIRDLASAMAEGSADALDTVMSAEHGPCDAYITLTACADHTVVVTASSEMWGLQRYWSLAPVTDPVEYVDLARGGARWAGKGLSLSDAQRALP